MDMQTLKSNIQWIMFILMLSSLVAFICSLDNFKICIPCGVATVMFYSIGLSNSCRKWSISKEINLQKYIIYKRFWES